MHITKNSVLTGMMLFVVPLIIKNELLAQTKRAILIGIGNYPSEGGWAGLSSKNDLVIIKNTLSERGFQNDHITNLTDEKATRKGILQLLNTEFLTQVQTNDIVYFHFSGHGQQKQDFEGDELDGLDECIVPYDSPKKFQKGVYEGQNLITDDELGSAFLTIRQKLGPKGQLFVVLDACHSGTGTRGMSSARGTTELMADPEALKNGLINSQIFNKTEVQFESGKSSHLAPMVSFFGAAQNQLNYEMKTEAGEQYGSLSYALAKHLTKVEPETSYRGLFDNIRIEMSSIAPLQNPQCEGELDMEIAKGKLLEKPIYYKASGIISDTEVIIKAGEIHGLKLGTELSLYPPETRDLTLAKPIAVGKITKTYPSESKILLDKALPKETIQKSWFYITQNNFGNLTIKLGTDIVDANIREGFENSIYSKTYILNDQKSPDIWAKYLVDKNQLVLSSKEGFVLETLSLKGVEKDYIFNKTIKAIRGYMQGELMRKMEMEGSDIQVSFKIIPSDSIGDEKDLDQLKYLQMDASGTKLLPIDTKIRVLIVNEGIKPAYFNLIDLQPDNKFTILIPGINSNPDEMRILPDQKILYPVEFIIGAPLGTEVFKLISSDKPLDLRSTANTRGLKTSSFEKLFTEDAAEEVLSTRSASRPKMSISDINIFSDTFIITNSKK